MTQTAPQSGPADPRSLPWIEALLRFDTTSRNSNLGLIETVRDHVLSLGLRAHLTYDAAGGKANLFATLPAADERPDGGLVLSGHTDVVPVDGQDWATDPFVPVIRDGRLYARGSADMKSFLGVAITLLQDLKGQRLKAPLHLALSYDEEVGCLGAPRMLQDLKDRGIRPAGCIVGEPTSMQVVTAHKGTNAYRCTVHGQAAHSSLRNKGVNAIEYAARIVCLIADLADAYETAGPFDDAFDVPFTTAQTGVIQGGIAINTIPDLCEFLFEFRNLPSLPAAELLGRLEAYANDTLLPRMRERAPGAQIRFERLAQAPALESDEAAEITRLVRALARDTGLTKVSYGTEGGQFQEAGIPAVICGPGDIRQAHRPDEFIALEQIVKCERFLAQLADKTRLPS